MHKRASPKEARAALANEFLTSRLPRFTAVGGLSIYANITVAEEVSGESKSSVLLTKPNEPAERLKKNRSNDVMSPRNWQENPAFTKVNESVGRSGRLAWPFWHRSCHEVRPTPIA
jgi:hypothetical protein